MLMSVIPWYFSLQLLAFAALPLTFSLCSRLHDRGYALAKALGLILTCYLTWLAAHIPAIGFSYNAVFGSAIVVATFSLISLLRIGHDLRLFISRNLRLIIVYEILFLVAYAAMVALRAQVPHISYHMADPFATFMDYAAEKFTDFAVLNGLLTSHHFPPHDPWVSGWGMNYYYFGHFLWASMIKFSGVRPEVGFNLGLATIFAMVCVQSFSLGYNLTRRLKWAALTMFLIALASNIDGFLQLVAIGKEALAGDTQGREWSMPQPWYKAYDFWRSSRAVEGTINEFPAFSFVLGDLHAHLSGLVIFLAGLILLIQVWRSARRTRSTLSYEFRNLDQLLFAALLIGCMSAANSWDVVTFAAVMAAFLYSGLRSSPAIARRNDRNAPSPGWIGSILTLETILLTTVIALLGTMVLFVAFRREFSAPFTSTPIKPVQPENRSDLLEFISHWILLAWAPVVCACIYMKRAFFGRRTFERGSPAEARQRFWAILCAGFAAAATLATVLQGWIAGGLVVICIVLACALLTAWIPPVPRLIVALLFVFSVLTLFCEIFYLDDIFEGSIERINTVFKIYYGLWPIMAIAAVLGVQRYIRYGKPAVRLKRTFIAIPAMLILGGAYPVIAPFQRIANTTRLAEEPRNLDEALDGLKYLKQLHNDDYYAINWICAKLPPDARILEAAGTQYTYQGRISTLTGRPTVAGWMYHAWGWRGDRFITMRNERIQDVKFIYTTDSAADALQLLNKYKVGYIVLGKTERQTYENLNEDKFAMFCEPVFLHGTTIIYRVKSDTPVASLMVGTAAQRISDKFTDILPGMSGREPKQTEMTIPTDEMTTSDSPDESDEPTDIEREFEETIREYLPED